MKKALITGITGQDGSYLAEFLLEKGIEKGLKKGREEGREETIKNIVANLKSAGMSIEIIANATGLTKEDIEELL